MERNELFPTEGLIEVVIHLAWAQLEVFADDVDQIQVLVAGDEDSVSHLDISQKNGVLLVEQPQYGLHLNLASQCWMQVCVRIPRSWRQEIRVNTINSVLNAHGLHGSRIALETVSGNLRVMGITGSELKLKTISGDVRGEELRTEALTVRCISGDIELNALDVKLLKCIGVSGQQAFHFKAPFERLESNVVSGNVTISSTTERLNVNLRSLGGRVRTQGVTLVEEEGVPKVRISGVSADVNLICIKE